MTRGRDRGVFFTVTFSRNPSQTALMDSPSFNLAFIEGLGGPEVVLILLIVLVLFGGEKLPDLARGLGKSIREFKKAAAGVEEEFKRALEENDQKKILPPPPATFPPYPPPPPAPALTVAHIEPHDESGNEPPAPIHVEPPSPAPTAYTGPHDAGQSEPAPAIHPEPPAPAAPKTEPPPATGPVDHLP
jgi:TatA/E family protein of Tat protein translocase